MTWELRRFLGYAAAGIAATSAHFVVMVVLVTWTQAPEVRASSIGFLAGACVKYPLNYWAVFASRQRHRVAVPRFALGLAAGFMLNASLLAILLRLLDVHYMLMQAVTTGVVLFANYLLARFWIFHSHTGGGGKKAV